MSTNNGMGFKHSPSLTPVQGKSPNYIVPSPEMSTSELVKNNRFDKPIILKQSRSLSRAILWGLMGVTTTVLIWAYFAKIEEAVPAQGKLEPISAVKEIQARVGGVVNAIYVKDGQRVKEGELLIGLEPTVAQAELNSLQKIRTALVQENQFYQAQINSPPDPFLVDVQLAQLQLPAQLISLTKSRATLAAENQIYRTQLGNGSQVTHLNTEQIRRIQFNQNEVNSRYLAAQLEAEQLSRQVTQNQIKLASIKDNLKLNQGLLRDMEPLERLGAISKIQYLKQQQEVRNAQADADELIQEQARLKLAINQAQKKAENVLDASRKELSNQIADNEKRIAEIDSQLTKTIEENKKRIAEIDSEVTKTQLTLKYQELRSPVPGTVFDLQAHSPGFVTNAGATILKIVPDDRLTAKIFITNKDIGFVKEGMQVDVRIESFPFSEFGDIKGKLVWIGDDALPPDQIHPFYRFPAKVQLEQQSLTINGRVMLLQSGMSVNANIKVRNHTVMSIFTDLFIQSVESFKSVR